MLRSRAPAAADRADVNYVVDFSSFFFFSPPPQHLCEHFKRVFFSSLSPLWSLCGSSHLVPARHGGQAKVRTAAHTLVRVHVLFSPEPNSFVASSKPRPCTDKCLLCITTRPDPSESSTLHPPPTPASIDFLKRVAGCRNGTAHHRPPAPRCPAMAPESRSPPQ